MINWIEAAALIANAKLRNVDDADVQAIPQEHTDRLRAQWLANVRLWVDEAIASLDARIAAAKIDEERGF